MKRIKIKSLSHTSNPTKLKKIHKKNFKVDLQQAIDDRIYFNINKIELQSLDLPKDASVFIYVTSGNSEMKFKLGTVGAIKEPRHRFLDYFSSNSTLWFRLLVVDDETLKILASAEKIRAKATHEDGREPLLPVELKDKELLKSRIWKVQLVPGLGPFLYLNKSYPKVLHQIKRSKIFQGLILQEAMRQSLLHFIESDRGDNNQDTWQYKWDLFLKDLNMYKDTPANHAGDLEIIHWVDSVIEVYSQNIKLFDNAVDEATQFLEKMGSV